MRSQGSLVRGRIAAGIGFRHRPVHLDLGEAERAER
jgi:hypothetical protein